MNSRLYVMRLRRNAGVGAAVALQALISERRKTLLKRSWQAEETCSISVELTRRIVTCTVGLDRCLALGAAHVAGLAETLAALQRADRGAVGLTSTLPDTMM